MLKSKILEEAGINHGFCGKESSFLDIILRPGKMEKFLDSIYVNGIYMPMQVHSNKVASIYSKKTADAVVTSVKGIAIAVRTADCAPILMYSKEAGVIAAVHAGWRGARSSVIQNAANMMMRFGARPETILAAIGPCITNDSYEVGEEFRDRFEERYIFVMGGKMHFDMLAFVEDALASCGITNIDKSAVIDTVKDENYHSYRRSGNTTKDRNISFIAL